ncbi:MAG: nucleotidyltransferase domain-containing protein [Sterolibacteriaceae bacterium]|nr:nucleotidyltransferase domain-containing protein [Candidatus Methylophosphatis haderslevensis]
MKLEVLSEHPIADAVRARVDAALDAIERSFDVRVVFACESGSRGWGFASPDSDYDVRFLYVHRLRWYLTVEAQRDVIELPIDDELDIGGWELRKSLQLLRKSNPTLLEWLDSPVVYRADSEVAVRLRELGAHFFNPLKGRYHYLAMAKRNYREHLRSERVRHKKYLYVLRPLLAVRWIDAGRGMAPMRFADLVAGTVCDAEVIAEINDLLAIKMRAGEKEYGARRPLLNDLIESELARAGRAIDYKKSEGNATQLDDFLFNTVMSRSEN